MRTSTIPVAGVVLGAGAALAVLSGCPASGGRPGVIKLVSSLPMQGSSLGQTQTIINGVKMAIEEAGGKVGEFTLEYEPWDDASAQKGSWDSAIESQNAQKAVADPDIMVYLGTYNSGAASVSAPIINRAGMLMVSPANTWPGLTKPGSWEKGEPEIYRPTGKLTYFRVVPADDLQGTVACKWAVELGLKRAYVLHDTEVYGKGIADIFKAQCEQRGITVVGYEGIDAKAPEYKALMAKVQAAAPDLVYFGGITQGNAGQVLKDMVGAGIDAKFMGPDGVYEKAFIEAAGAANANGRCYITFGGIPPRELTGKGKEFFDRYKAKFGHEPEAYAVYGYEAARVAIEALRRAGKKDRDAIAAACAGIKDFDGVLGTWSFDQNGDTSLSIMSCNTVKDGQFVFEKFLSATD